MSLPLAMTRNCSSSLPPESRSRDPRVGLQVTVFFPEEGSSDLGSPEPKTRRSKGIKMRAHVEILTHVISFCTNYCPQLNTPQQNHERLVILEPPSQTVISPKHGCKNAPLDSIHIVKGVSCVSGFLCSCRLPRYPLVFQPALRIGLPSVNQPELLRHGITLSFKHLRDRFLVLTKSNVQHRRDSEADSAAGKPPHLFRPVEWGNVDHRAD